MDELDSIKRAIKKSKTHYVFAKKIVEYFTNLSYSDKVLYLDDIKFMIRFNIESHDYTMDETVKHIHLIRNHRIFKDLNLLVPTFKNPEPFLIDVIMAAFASAHRNDFITYETIYEKMAKMDMIKYYAYLAAYSVPYIYDEEEQAVVKKLIKRSLAISDEKFDLDRKNAWYCVYIARKYKKNLKSIDIDIVDIFNDKYEKTRDEYVESLMSVRPQPSVFVPNDKHLSSNKYVDMIYKENVPDIETGKIRKPTSEFPRNDRLYIEYLSPSDLTNVTGIKTDTKVVFIGESHGKTPAQNFGFDPRFGFGEVGLPFKSAIISEEKIPLPKHLSFIGRKLDLIRTTDDIYERIANVHFDANKLQLCLQILFHFPEITGYAPRIVLDVRNDFATHHLSNNFTMLELLYRDMNHVEDIIYPVKNFPEKRKGPISDAKYSKKMEAIVQKIKKLRMYLFGRETITNVKEYPSDLRFPFEDNPIFSKWTKTFYSTWTVNDLPFIRVYSFSDIVLSLNFNPQKGVYYYYRALVKWTYYSMAGFKKFADPSVMSDVDEIVKEAKSLYELNWQTFKQLVNNRLDICERKSGYNYRASLVYLLMRHPEFIPSDKPTILRKLYLREVSEDTAKQIYKKCLAEVRAKMEVPDNYCLVVDDSNEDDGTRFASLAKKMSNLFTKYQIDISSKSPKLKPMKTADFKHLLAKIGSLSGLSQVQFTQEFMLHAEPFTDEKIAWDFINYMYSGMMFKKAKSVPSYYRADEIDSRMSSDLYEPTAAMVETTNIGFWDRLYKLLKSEDPPEVVFIVCGYSHALHMISQVLKKLDEKGLAPSHKFLKI